MSADYENLKAFLIASTRSQLSTQLALEQMSITVKLLEHRLNRVDAPSEDARLRLEKLNSSLEEYIKEMNANTETLLNSLEKYADG